MIKIAIKKGDSKITVPAGIYVNGYIIKAPVCPPTKSMIELNNRVNTNVHTDHKGD